MGQQLSITPQGHLVVLEIDPAVAEAGERRATTLPKRILAEFAESPARGMLHLATAELQTALPADFDYVRSIARTFLTRLCQTPVDETSKTLAPLAAPTNEETQAWILDAPPMKGLEYLKPQTLIEWWSALDELVRDEIAHTAGGPQAYLSEKNPSWRFVGRVTFHLAENKRDPDSPFAFLATYAKTLSSQGRVQHEPLGRSLEEYAGAKNRQALLNLLVPIQKAAERSELAKELVETGDVYSPLAWTPAEAYQFLRDVPIFEESGLIVRVPDWWNAAKKPRPVVNVKVDGRKGVQLTARSMLEFSVNVALDGETLTEDEMQALLDSAGGLVQLKGKWVEVDREKLGEALDHWKKVEREAEGGGLSFFEGMRLLSGASLDNDSAGEVALETREWTGLSAGSSLEQTLERLRSLDRLESPNPPGLRAELRPYQRTGFGWLRFMSQLGLGACLADDMGLGKTVQVIALLTAIQAERESQAIAKSKIVPCLLVVPASLIANWKAEIRRFAPTLEFSIAHSSEVATGNRQFSANDIVGRDLVITTYGMVTRLEWLRKQNWNLVILDEAQAIKNAGTRQTRTVKELNAAGRIALTGTPVENRLSDLWSLFDFLNPGLLGNAKAFGKFVKRLSSDEVASFKPLRTLVQPYILRRLKTDKRVIADLPDKTEVKAYCPLSKQQAALYEQAVRDLEFKLKDSSGIQRRGLVLAQLMRLKQICNHPAHMLGHGEFDPEQSGKFKRLAELCEEMASRQEKTLIFTQFREMTDPLAKFLQTVFGRPGLVLHGGTAVAKRRDLVDKFQGENGPPFFVLSLKAGGTGLNLTAASQVIHFDRWWNPAVENQATDRAFRIGQKRNVLVHKFVCQGTVEEKIDELMEEKMGLSDEILEGGETMLTELKDDELLKMVALDVNKALA